MSSVREQILDTIFTELQTINGVQTFKRNDLAISDEQCPAIVLLDGDEEVDSDYFQRGRPPSGPNVMLMHPEIYVTTMSRPEEVGTSLNTFLDRIIRTLANSADLLELVYNNDIRYEGMQSGLAIGRALVGDMGMVFTVAYVRTASALEGTEESTE